MRVLVTGAGGFLGRRLMSVLEAEGFAPFGTTRSATPCMTGKVVTLSNALDATLYRDVIRQHQIDAVINTIAAGVDPRERDIDLLVQSNTLFPSQLARACKEAGARLLLHIGSSAEYAPVEKGDRMKEDAPLICDRLYGASKAAGSLLVRATATEVGLRMAVLRLFNIFGPGEKSYRLFPSLIARLGRGERVPLSAGTQVRDFLFVDDACRSLAKMLAALSDSADAAGDYNLASGRALSVRDFALAIADAINADRALLAFGELALRPDDLPFVVADTQRLERLIGPAQTTSIAEAVRQTRGNFG